MKKLLLALAILPITASAQTITSVQDGDFFNPLTWDCTCIPMNGMTVNIDHAVVLNLDVAYNTGSINVSTNGSLIEDATDRAFWVDGTATFSNAGTFTSHLLLASPDAEILNSGNMPNIDSVWIQGLMSNTGTMEAFDVLNDETAEFENEGMMNITNDFNNQGYYYIASNASLEVGNDFSNCNLQTEDAYFENDGVFCITNDFSNCGGDTLDGEGNYYIGGSSSNLGVFTGDFTFHTPSGTLGLPGTIDPSVTVTTGTCTLQLYENEQLEIVSYPNPVVDQLTVNIPSGNYYVMDLAGKTVSAGAFDLGTIDLSSLNEGIYILEVIGYGSIRIVKATK